MKIAKIMAHVVPDPKTGQLTLGPATTGLSDADRWRLKYFLTFVPMPSLEAQIVFNDMVEAYCEKLRPPSPSTSELMEGKVQVGLTLNQRQWSCVILELRGGCSEVHEIADFVEVQGLWDWTRDHEATVSAP